MSRRGLDLFLCWDALWSEWMLLMMACFLLPLLVSVHMFIGAVGNEVNESGTLWRDRWFMMACGRTKLAICSDVWSSCSSGTSSLAGHFANSLLMMSSRSTIYSFLLCG